MAACLLIHGFGGSDFEMEPLIPVLQDTGYTVKNILLPGHGTSVADFQTTFFPDWLRYAKEQYRLLAQDHQHVAVIGLSMGGTIALTLAEEFPVAAVVSLAAPAFIFRVLPWQIKDFRLLLLPLLAKVRPVVNVRSHSAESQAIAPWKGYDGVMCLPQLVSLKKGVDTMACNLSKATAPVLIIQDKRDRLVNPDCAHVIAQKIGSSDVTIRLTTIQETVTSHHVLTTHRETKEFVAREVVMFLKRVLG